MEAIFGLPGMVRFLVDAISQRYYPVAQGVYILIAWLISPERKPSPAPPVPPTVRPPL